MTYRLKALLLTFSLFCFGTLAKAQITASFTATQTNICEGIAVGFIPTINSTNPVASVFWDFGDSVFVIDPIPYGTGYVYNTAGTYTVRLVVNDILGNTDTTTVVNMITVNPNPDISLTVNPTAGCQPLDVQLTPTTSNSSTTGWTWTWTFSSDSICFAGDGRDTIIRTNPNPFTTTFTDDGIYDVKLVVENQLNCQSDTTVFNAFTVEPKPVASFTAQVQPDCDSTTNVVFTSTSALPCTPSPMYNWNFGDGTGSVTTTLSTYTYEYQTSGTFTVQLIVTDGIPNGCADTTTQTIVIAADPTVTIQAPNTACATESIQFNGSSSGVVTGWAWDFGDGNTSTLQNPTHTYANPGCFTPSLTVTIDTCTFTTVFDTCIIINPKPSAVFSSLDDFETCTRPHSMTFTSTVIGTLTPTYAWNFGDGTTSSDQNPTKTWNYAGTYPMSLTVSTPQGCSSPVLRDTVIIDSIDVNFTSDIVGGCEPVTVQFSDISTSFTGATGWLWRFGDGNTSTQQNPTHTYMSAGVYDVELVITTAQGCTDSLTMPNYINVGTPPTLSFTVSDNAPCINENISFINNSSSGTNWLWFNGLDTVSGFNIPDTFYAASGSYDVWLSAENNGCIDTLFQNNLINLTDLEVVIGTDGDCEISPTGVDFIDNSTGAVIDWAWDFGVDGITDDTSTSQNPSYTYPAVGEYVTTLTITDASGCTLTDSTTVDLDPPVASFGWTTDTVECVSVDFPVEIIDSSENHSDDCRWILPDEITHLFGSSDSICEPIFSFDTVGVYDISLIVRSDQGCLDTITKQICATDVTAVANIDTTGGTGGLIKSPVTFIDNGNPIVGGNGGCIIQLDSLTGDTTYIAAIGTNPINCNDPNLSLYTGCTPLTVEFSDSSFGFPDSIVSYIWDFGDGNTSSEPNPTHTYTESSGALAYMVTLTVTNEFGVINTDTIPAFIRPTQPSSNFSISRDTVCTDLAVTAADSSSGFDLSYQWVFGNGDTSTVASPSFSYATEGNYEICLTVTDINGCDSTVCDSIVVIDPVANFSADTTYSACENLTVTFTDSSENTISWLWLFGNDSTSNLQNPAVVYSGTGAYDLTLIAGGAGGCQDTLTVSNFVQVDGPALASMSVSPTDSCEDHRVGFNIQGSNIGIVTIEFGDGTDTTFGTFTSIALDTTIFYVYDTAGIYNPVLRIEDSLNCERVFNFNTITTTDPLASFTIDTTLGCTPLAVTANGNMSEFANQYEWIAPGAFIAGQSTPAPTFIYQNEGYYNEITLVVTDVNGCTDTLSFTDTITAVTAHAGFFPDVTTGCYPLDVQFTDTSSAFADTIVAWNWQFVNGDTDTLQNPSYTYDGAVNVNQRARLTVTSSYGCTDVVQQNILPTFPTAAFIADSLACTEQTVNFTNQSTGLTLSYLWDFGDDSTSTDVNPTHFYESEDTFMITLTVTDVNGCVDIDTLERIIVADPIANFSSDKTFIACAPDSVQFTDLSQNAIAWDWIIEGADPEVYNIQNPAVAYTIPGSYDVQLIITSPSGCQDTMRVDSMITVDGPYGTLSFTPTEGCVDLTVDFVLPLTNTANLIFDNGESVEVFVNPGDTLFYSYTYTQRGTQTPYTPTVFIQDALGCQRTLTGGSITVTDPEPIFTVSPDTSCIPMTITTTNSSLDVDDFEWIAPTLNIDDPNNFTPTFTANNAGFHDISLVITDVYGCTDTMTQTILASDVTANASSNVTAGCLPLTVQFTDLSTDFPVGSINSWLWVFGDGNGVSTDQNPSYVYTTIGDFTPTLTVTNVHGCSKTFTLPSINVTFPNASYVPSLTFACTGQDILFDNQSSGQNVTYLWNFDNGQTSTDEDPIFAFANEGTYNVCLTTTDDNGCDSTYCQTITIANPVANFTVDNQYLPCPPATFNFTDASANAVSWFWTFGDGNTSTDQNPSNTYTETGLYDVQLIVTSASGCMDTLFQPTFIEVGGPVGNFTFTPNQGCADVTATFTGNVTSNTVDLYIWNFGDGSNSTSITNSNTNTVTHTYTTTGTFFPTLTLQDNTGCQFVATLDSIEVDTLQFDFFANDTLTCEVGDFTFTPYIASSSPIDSVRWNFVGADVTTSTMMSPTISYSNVGDFDVELTVYSRHCTKTITKTQYIKIAPNPVTNVLIAPTDGCNPTTVNFTDATTIFSGSVVSWAWDLGNGTTDTLQNTSTMYTAVGQYDVQLITVSNHGCADTLLMVDTVTIYPIPNPTFDLDTFACTGQDVFFTNTSSGNNLTYSWNFGDGNISTDFEPVHQYASEGTFVVCLTVTSSDGCDSTLCKTVTIADPLAALSSNVVYVDCPGDSISFIDQSVNAISWFWSFGDGDTSILQNPTHAYAATGFYDVQLIVTGLSGCQDTILQPAYIEVGGPVGNFTFTPNQGCADVTATFTGNVTSNTVDLYIWNFGDGSNSTSITNSNTNTVTHTYTTTGTFFPTLTLQDNAGCQFVATLDSIEVDTLQFDFIVDTTLACENGTFTFTPTIASSSPIDSIRWNFVGADVTTSTMMSPTITYSNVGDFDVELTVYSRHCTKTVTKSQLIKIAPNPVTNFTVSPAEGCNPTTVFFTDATTIFSGSVVSWAWDFGEGSLDSSQNTTNSYDTVGVFDVQLITVSDFGCTNTLLLTDTITINPIPNPTFDLDTFACTNQDVFFTNTSTGINLTYSWNFGDGNISTDFEPVHQYASEGTFVVCLTVTSSDGCDSTLCKTVTIANPLAAFTSNVQYIDCPSDSISFIDQSANAISWFWSFGDDSTSTEQNPSHAYAATGFYDVQLIVEGASGCFDTLLQTAYIEVGGPVGNFTFTPNQGCADVTATFTGNVTQNTVTQYIWNYGNGTIDTVASTSLTNTINHTYTSTGTFFPTLTLVDNANCPFVATLDSIEVDTLQFDFVVDTTLACENGTFTFTPTIASSSPIDSVVWNFVGADVTTSNAMMPTITYSNVGDFDVELTVYSRHCTKTVTKSQLIKIAPNPVTNFTVSPAEGCNPTTVFFTDATTIFSGSIVSWVWDFGEGSLDSSQNTANSYDTVGVFDVQLITVSDFGCTNTLLLTDTITINPIPHPIFDLDTFACANQDVFFTNTSTGNTLTYNWDFGDGNSSTAFEPVHQYTTEDTFTVCLTVTDVNGCDSTLCKTVIIANPVANFTSNTQYLACPPDSVQFTDASANAVAWHWTFGDGDTSILQNPTHTYTTTGFYDVQLIVTGLSGCQDTLLQTNYIEVGGPVGNFTFTPKQGCADVTTTFVGTLTANSVAQYHWNFGNGDSITHTTNMPIDSFEYIYTTAGTFFPTLVLEDSTGCTFDISLDSIEVDTLQFDFVASNTLFCETDVITFTPTIASSSPIDSMIWTFNGAIISTSMDSIPVIPYDTIGDFDVSLTVFSDHCSKTVTKTQYIKAAPIPESYFTTTTNPFCSEQTINFNDATNLFSGSVVSWNWNFGDLSGSNLQDPTHVYADSGFYNINLFATSDFGCTDDTTITVYVNKTPEPMMTVAPTLCIGEVFTLTASGGDTYEWYEGVNLICDTCTSIDVAPIVTTNYTLVAISAAGCRKSITQTVNVLPYTIPPLEVSNDTTICKGDVIQLFASGGYDVTQYNWDASITGLSCYNGCSNPFASPEVTTTFYVTLTWDGGCSKTDSITVTIIDDAQPILGVDRTICQGESVQLGISTGGNATWFPGDGLSCVFCDNPVASPDVTTTYSVEVITVNGCTIRDTMTINVQTPDMIDAGEDATICDGNTIQLNGSAVGDVTWIPAATLSDSSIVNPIATPTVTTDYILTVQNDLCIQLDTVRITVADKVDIAVEDIEICEDEVAEIDIIGYAESFTFLPDTGVLSIDPTLIQPTETTTYTVIGDIPFCESDTATFTITVNPTPDIGLLPQMTVFKNTVTPLPIDYPNSQYIHTWTPSTLLSCPDCFNPFFIADSTFSEMTIYVDLLTGEGCSFTDSILVTLGESCGNDLVKLPTAFTPNDDGNNDIFRVRGIGISDIEIFRVYNRWGEQLFETSQLNEGWDGTHKGEKVEQGVYMYYVQAICPLTGEVLTFKGDVFLHF